MPLQLNTGVTHLLVSNISVPLFLICLDFEYAILADTGEGEAARLAYSRLQELPCRWDGCDVRLNSVNKLVEHLRQHKPRDVRII